MSIQRPSRIERARLVEHRKERLPIVIDSANAAIKSAFLVNGGGAVALLALLGQMMQAAKCETTVHAVATALFLLVIGTALAGIATGISFLAQYGYFMRKQSKFGKAAPYLTLFNFALILASYGSFVAAGFVAYRAIA